jgi:acetolactate synthase-1/2/3 large subunit
MANGDESTTRIQSGGEATAEALIANGVDTVFGIPGIQLDPLFDAFFHRSNTIRVVHNRHEQGSAFMAMGYAQSSDKTGAFVVVPGPGLLNAMGAVSTAVAANTPILGLTGQIPSNQIGLNYGVAHELRDQLMMSRGVVGWANRAEHPSEVPAMLNDAFRYMHSGRKQPAVFEMAPDHYAARAPVTSLAGAQPDAPPPLDEERIKQMAERLSKARCPAIFVGGGVLGANAELRQLAERLNAPVIETVNGRGAMPSSHPLWFHILAGQEIWPHIDVALVVGTRFLAPALAWGRADEVDMLRIDIDPTQMNKPRRPTMGLVADAGQAMQGLFDELGEGAVSRDEFLATCVAGRDKMDARLADLGNLPELANAVRRALPENGILVTDVTQLGYYARHCFPVEQPRQVLGPSYQATLGYAMPAALGAKLANPDCEVVAVAGDGGFMFTMQELAVAAQAGIAVVTIVLDNGSYGNVKTIQDQRFGGRNIAVELHNPDFVAMARSFGLHAEEATNGEELEAALRRSFATRGPALIRVPMGEVPSIWDMVVRPPSQGQA